MIRFLKLTSILILAVLITGPSVGCRAIYSDDTDVDNAFRKDATFDWVGTARPKDENLDYFGVSDKARAIEKHMGGE